MLRRAAHLLRALNGEWVSTRPAVALTTTSVQLSHGGPAYSVPAIARALATVGLDPVLATQDDVPRDASGQPVAWKRLMGARVIHHFGLWDPFHQAVCVGAALTRRPLVLSPIGMLEPWCLAYKPRRKRLALALYQRRNLERAVVLHATAQSEADQFRALGLAVPIAVIPHGVDAQRLIPRGHRDGPRTALFLSRIHPKKGLLMLVEAWSRIRPTQWRMVIAGPDEGGHRAEVEALIKRRGLHEQFEFVGAVAGDAKRTLMEIADLFVLPTHSENFGNAIAEALAFGIPTITTRGAPWSALAETNSGWWIDVGIEPLVYALEQAFSSAPSTLSSMGERGRSLVEERYGWGRSVARYADLYRWVLKAGPRPDFVQLGRRNE
jgi:glycosyltransferase involved in cell wall biosynthesis